MSTTIAYGNEKYFKSFHEALDLVAREKIYIEMIEAKPFEEVSKFQAKLIAQNVPVYYAINDDRVVGWIDISIGDNPRLNHRGHTGMGIIEGFREQGVGSQLMKAALAHAKEIGLEKVELQVYSSNVRAVAFYKKFGFEQVGVIKNYRKLENQYFDVVVMERFL